jgi:hypothetical protein
MRSCWLTPPGCRLQSLPVRCMLCKGAGVQKMEIPIEAASSTAKDPELATCSLTRLIARE